MSPTQITADQKVSKTLDHITSYPVVSTGIETFKSQPLGRKSIDLTHTGYNHMVAPFIPYARGPYSHIAPYVAHADALANSGLDKVDSRFPLVKTQPTEIKNYLLSFAAWPFQLVGQTKTHVVETYDGEYSKCGKVNNKNEAQVANTVGQKYFTSTKALLTTSLILTSQTVAWFSAFLSARKQEGTQFASQKYTQGIEYASSTKDYVVKEGQNYVQKAQEIADQTGSTVTKKADETKGKASKKVDQAKKTAEQKSN